MDRCRTRASRGLAFLLAVAIIVVAVACAGGCRDRARSPERTNVARPPITDVLARHTSGLMAIPGVVGTYEGALEDGTPCIGILVVKLTPALRDSLPRKLEGWPVRIEESGEIKPMGGR